MSRASFAFLLTRRPSDLQKIRSCIADRPTLLTVGNASLILSFKGATHCTRRKFTDLVEKTPSHCQDFIFDTNLLVIPIDIVFKRPVRLCPPCLSSFLPTNGIKFEREMETPHQSRGNLIGSTNPGEISLADSSLDCLRLRSSILQKCCFGKDKFYCSLPLFQI